MKVSGQLYVPAALPRGKTLRYPLDRKRVCPNKLTIHYQRIICHKVN